MTTTLLNRNSTENVINLNNKDIDLNELFTLSYNFDMLKGVLTTILSQNKEAKKDYDDLKEKLEQKDKLIGNLEIKLVNSVRMLSEKLEEKTKDIEESLRQNNSNNEDSKNTNNRKLDDTVSALQSRIEKLELEDKKNKDRIVDLEAQVLDLSRLKDSVKKNENDVYDMSEKLYIYDSKFSKIERNITELTAKFNEINIFEVLKNKKKKKEKTNNDEKEEEEDNENENENEENTQSLDTYLLLLEGVKTSFTTRMDNTDNKLDLIHETLNRLNNEVLNHSRNIKNNSDKLVELDEVIDKLYKTLQDLKHSNLTPKDRDNKSKKSDEKDKAGGMLSLSDEKYDEILNRIKDLEEKLKNLESLNIGDYKAKDNLSVNTNAASSVGDDQQLRIKILEIEKHLKVLNLKEKEREETMNKKINNLNELLKKKVDLDAFYNYSEEVDILKRKLEEFKQEYKNLVEGKIMEEITWLKKKI